ncbi:MAG: sugar ABC transporter substrate-binding protein [Oscillospiraceae bacterium]|nr:sugar ABC transporter substrate-binding protein [Oscillospiraceae bacterium]
MKKIKILLCIALIAALSLAVIACDNNDTPATPDAPAQDVTPPAGSGDFDWRAHAGTTLNIMFNQHPYADTVIERIPEFEALTGITVRHSVTPEENYFDVLTLALNARSGNPDIFMTGAYQIWDYAPAGFIQPLEDFINDPARTFPGYNFADFYEAVVGALRWDLVPGNMVGTGSQWALPMGFELNNLAFNQRIFDEHGLEPPRTTEELLTAAKALHEFNGPGTYGVALRGTRNWATIHPGYMTLFATWGARDFEVVDGRLVSRVDSPEAIAMTDFWVELIRYGGPPQWTTYTWYQAGASFGAGNAAMLFDATCNGYFQNYPAGASAESGNLAWLPGPLPPGATYSRSNIWIWSMAMNAYSQNQDAAWLFMQYFTGPEFQAWAGTRNPDAPRRSVSTSAEYIGVVGASVGYLEALEADLPHATIQFTPQPEFIQTTTMWAATLQDLVAGQYSSTEEAMRNLAERKTALLANVEIPQ